MRKNIFVVILFLLFTTIIYADTFPPMILHTSQKEVREGIDLTLTTTVIDNEEVESVILYYRTDKLQPFTPLTMTAYSGSVYQTTIPASSILPPQIEYYLEAKDKSGNISREPVNPTISPYSLKVISIVKTEEKKIAEKSKPSGNYTINIQDSEATYPTNPAQPNTDLIATQPGTWINYNLNLIHQYQGQTLTFWLNRETESYRGKTWDKFRLSLTDNQLKTNTTFGDFYGNFSKLSLDGVSITGLGIKSLYGKNNFQVIAARSQRSVKETSKSSPIYRQYLFALRKEIETEKSKFAVNLGYSSDDPESIPAPTSLLTPQETMVLTMDAEHKINNDLKLETEFAVNNYDKNLNDTNKGESDNAYKIKLLEESENLTFNALYQRTGSNYVSCGTLENYMENDKKGYLADFEYRPVSLLSFSGKYERYKDNLDKSLDGTTTTTENYFSLSITPENIPAITGRIGNLKREGESNSESKNKGIGLSYNFKGIGAIGNTFILGNYQRIDYEANLVRLRIDMVLLNLNTAYKDKIVLSLSHNYSRTRDIEELTSTRKKINSVGITYVVIPFKFVTLLSYQYTKNAKDDNSVYNREESISWTNSYNITETKVFSIGLKLVSYDDKINPDNNYENTVLTFKMSQSF